MARMIHFKCPYDQNIEWDSVCGKLFTGRYLCVMEKAGTNTHLHIQGETFLSEKRVEAIQSEFINKVHHLRAINPKCHICRTSHGDVDESGFQYMCKENLVKVVTQSGFSQEDIDALHQKSEEHVEELKSGYKRSLDEIEYSGNPDKYHKDLSRAFVRYYRTAKKNCPPQSHSLLLNYMNQKDPCPTELEDYVVTKICKL